MERQRSSIRRRRRASVKPFAHKCKECVRSFVAFMFSNVGIIGLVVGYAIAGAFLFMRIEREAPKEQTRDVVRNRLRAASIIWNITTSFNVFHEIEWKEQVNEQLTEYQNFTVEAISFSGAFLYSLTVITTIGYGNIVPKTFWGKVATIVYAIIGMPLFLLYLSNIGDIMARSFKWIYATCYLCKGCPGVSRRRAERRKHRLEELEMEPPNGNGDTNSEEDSYQREDVQRRVSYQSGTTELSEESFDAQTITVPITVCLTMMVSYVVGGAMLFKKYESWDLLDGSYFCFISLSTIGFGDLVPGDKIYSSTGTEFDIELSFIFCSMYLMLGMALIAMCFNLMQEEVIHKFRRIVNTVKYMCRCNR